MYNVFFYFSEQIKKQIHQTPKFMETTQNKINLDTQSFFKDLSAFIDLPIYFYGSVQRTDYFPGQSDIDVDIFTENPSSTLAKLQSFLNTPTKKYKTFIWKLKNKYIVRGKKLQYHDPHLSISVEFSIYNEKYKSNVLREHREKTKLAFYQLWALWILKFIHYKLHLLPKSWFFNTKRLVLNGWGYSSNEHFLVISKR